MNSKLNVVFHHIRKQVEDCTSPYDLCEDQMHTVLSRLCDILNEQGHSLGVFFDDGYLEHYASAIALQEMYGINVVLGVPTESVGEDGYMTWDHIKKLASTGHTIASHGVSHAALGRYENDVVLPTPADGLYRNTSKGKGMVLSAAEVAYQVVESHRVMITSGVRVDAFIYPYGIFNKEISRGSAV